MKVTFVHPPALMAVDNYSTITQPPLGIGYLAAYVRQLGHKVAVVDAVGDAVTRITPWPLRERRLFQGLSFEEIYERIPEDSDVIGLSCMFTHAWPMVRELMKGIKRRFPHARLIAGGEHTSSMYEAVLTQTGAEACVLGEGEVTLGELLAAFESGGDLSKVEGLAYCDADGKVVKTGARKRIADPDTLPWPAWDLMDPMMYLAGETYMGPNPGRSMPMLATRGCPFRCTFCSSPQMWTQVWKTRNPVKVCDEMEYYMQTYGADDFQFQDLTAIVRKDWIVAFCQEIIRRGLKLTWSLPVGTRSEAIDQEVARYLKASGCHHVTYAPESGSDRILKSIEKKVHLGHLEESARGSLAEGLKVCLFMIVGFPQEEPEDIKKTFAWLRRMARLGVHEVAVSTFVPLPGTQLFHETNAAKSITVDDEYCYWMTGATSLTSIKSWHPKMSDARLRWLKLSSMGQFYLISYYHHPRRLWAVIRNFIKNQQETKVDRVLREFANKFRAVGQARAAAR
jgi:anaerobic magnesium-protoporphyrin IX monomethyl ester cyclase